MTREQAAEVLECTPRNVSAMVAKGLLTNHGSGRALILSASEVRSLARARKGYSGRGGKREGAGRPAGSVSAPAQPAPVSNGQTKIAVDTRHRQVQTAILSIRLREKQGQVIDVGAVSLAWAERAAQARRELERSVGTITDQVSADLGLDDEKEEVVRHAVSRAMRRVIESIEGLRFGEPKA